jgi:hypothetical protein
VTPEEIEAWKRLDPDLINEELWLACPVADRLLGTIIDLGASERKLRLFGCACLRLVWHHLGTPESKAAVEAAERFALGEISADEMTEGADAALAVIQKDDPPRNTDLGRRQEYITFNSEVAASEVARADREGEWIYWQRLLDIPGRVMEAARYQRSGLDLAAMEKALCDRLRDIVGNPHRSHAIASSWRTPAVMRLSSEILADRAFDRMPILANALDDAGCTDEEMLAHCRDPRDHVLGCWVVDLLLGHSWKTA